MRKEGTDIAKRGATTPAQQNTGYGQMVVAQEMPDKTLISRINTGMWKKDQHFYTIKEYDKETRENIPVNRPLLDGKMFIGALAGCRHETRILDRQPDYVRAEATVYYRTPTGEVAKFTREKEVSIQLERAAAITRKVNGKLNQIKGTYAGKGANPELYNKVNKAAMMMEDEGKRQQYLMSELLDIIDLQEVTDNMIKLRQTLANMAASKALSSAYTEFLRYIGQRIVFKGAINEDIEVMVINTVEIPKGLSSNTAVNLMYGGEDPEGEAIETEHLLNDETAINTEGSVMVNNCPVDVLTGEVIEVGVEQTPETSDEEDDSGAAFAFDEDAIKEDLVEQIKEGVTLKKLNKSAFMLIVKDSTGSDDFKTLGVDGLNAVLEAVRGCK